MSKKVISLGLSDSEINNAITELENYKKEIIQKTDTLRKKVAKRIAELAQSGFNGAIADDITNGSPKTASVSVLPQEQGGSLTVVIADGEDAVWVEFGAGVYHNGGVGSSPNPYGAKLGFTIGSYGEGHGKQKAWGYYDENEKLVLTHGTQAKMPMARAVTEVCNEIRSIAKEVFG